MDQCVAIALRLPYGRVPWRINSGCKRCAAHKGDKGMKRFKKLVIGGIESKVVALILISMMLVAAVLLASMLTQSGMLSHLTQ